MQSAAPTPVADPVGLVPVPRHLSALAPLPDVASPQRVLDAVLAAGALRASSLDEGYQDLWASLASATEGGKRFRPGLFTATYQAWGGTDWDVSAAVAAAIELVHTAFTVHDDVIDDDDVRRGRLNVAGSRARAAREAGATEEQAQRLGATAGILAGDLALAAAVRVVATCDAPTGTVHRLLDLFDHVLHVTAAGELADVWMSVRQRPSTLSEVLLMGERKTAMYSFALPMQAAAVLAGAPEEAVEAVGRVGSALGVAFQLADDLDGMFGDPEVTGKSAVSDLRGGKHTALIAHARGTAAWSDIEPFVGSRTLTPAEAERVRRCLTSCGSRRFVQQLADEHRAEAKALAALAGLPLPMVEVVRTIADDLIGGTA